MVSSRYSSVCVAEKLGNLHWRVAGQLKLSASQAIHNVRQLEIYTIGLSWVIGHLHCRVIGHFALSDSQAMYIIG